MLLQHLAEVWPTGEVFMPTTEIVDALVYRYPDVWGRESSYGKDLTVQRFGRMLATNYKINSSYPTPSHIGSKGYRLRDLAGVMGRMGLTPPPEPPERPQHPERPDDADPNREVKEAWEVRDVHKGGSRRSTCRHCGKALMTADSVQAGVCIPCRKAEAA